MSGANDPATSTAGTSGPRPVPSRWTAGRTAAAWLSVNGNEAPGAVVGPGAEPVIKSVQYAGPPSGAVGGNESWPTGENGRERVPTPRKLP
ncbi:hypothetical protein GCM10010260_68510 [Streptomyces filipinensis]|uniref:Uncharacterized protein n=1 Tax=Streptomyces filipinensis TaxID=66887 RepID=A0A918MEY3_9ACTN|nr:hypothetical protein GCM10010260_68510 [Streptomyces filipinensis]